MGSAKHPRGGSTFWKALRCDRGSPIPRSALRHWVSGSCRPRIGTLLRMCYSLRVPLTALLDNTDPPEAAPLRDERAIRRWRCEERVRIALDQALTENPPPSLTQVARRLNYLSTDRLYEVDPSSCRKLVKKRHYLPEAHSWRRAGAQRICDRARINKLLENSLAQEHPTSAYHIAIGLGYSGGGSIWQEFPDLCRAIGKKIASNKRRQLGSTQQALRAALEESPAPSLEQVRKRLGYETPTTLRNYFPELCRALICRRARDRAEKKDKVRRTLEVALAEEPPPTIRAVSQRLGLSKGRLYSLHPELIRAIADRHRARQHHAMKERGEITRREVFQIVADLHRQGERPAHAMVLAALSANAIKEWHTVGELIKEARRALSIR